MPVKGYLVLGTHRQAGDVYVWCGVNGFQALAHILERGDLAGQLVKQADAVEIMRHVRGSSSDEKFILSVLPVADITFERPRVLLPH